MAAGQNVKPDSLARAAATGIDVQLGEYTLTIRPFCIGDVAAFEKYLRSHLVNDWLAVAKEVPPFERIEVLTKLAQTIFDDGEVMDRLGSLEGIRFLLLREMKKQKPDITEDELNEMITLEEMENMGAIMMSQLEMSEPESSDPSPAPLDGTSASAS